MNKTTTTVAIAAVLLFFLIIIDTPTIHLGSKRDQATSCFLEKTTGSFGQDYVFVQTDVRSDGTVSGLFNLVPAEKGSIVGTISGTWTEQSPEHIGLNVLYTYTIEDTQQTEPRLFTMDAEALYIVWNNSYTQKVPKVSCAQVPPDIKEPVIVSKSTQLAPVTFTCKKQKTLTIKFVGVDKIELSSSDKGGILMNHVLSASGARYATADESIVASNSGNMLTVTEKGKATYENCVTKSSIR